MAIFAGKLVIRRELLPKMFIGAALDRGGTMTKVAFVRKSETTEESEEVTVEFFTFKNEEFREALILLKENAHLKVDQNLLLPATGIGTTRYQQEVKDILGLGGMTQFNEFSSQIFGIAFLANHFKHSDFTYEHDRAIIASRQLAELSITGQVSIEAQMRMLQKMTMSGTAMAIQQMMQAMSAQSTSPSLCKSFPALIIVGGSAFPIAIMDEETLKSLFFSGVNVGGKTFLGLSNLLLGTTEFSEICNLAKAAEPVAPEKTDLPSDKYEQLNQTLIDGFEFNPSRTKGSREAIARALVDFFARQIAEGMAVSIALSGLTSAYFTGGFFMSSLIRNEIVWRIESLLPNIAVQLHFLKNSSVGALGSLMCADELQKDLEETNSRFQAMMQGGS